MNVFQILHVMYFFNFFIWWYFLFLLLFLKIFWLYFFLYIFSLLNPNSLITKSRKGAYSIYTSYLPYFEDPFSYFYIIGSNVSYGGLTIHHLTDKFYAVDFVVQIKNLRNSLETSSAYKIKCDNALIDLFKFFLWP